MVTNTMASGNMNITAMNEVSYKQVLDNNNINWVYT